MAILESKDLRQVLIAVLGTGAAVVGVVFAVQSVGGDSNHCQDHSVCGRSNSVGDAGVGGSSSPAASASSPAVSAPGSPSGSPAAAGSR
ncbi:hypothetical protein ABH931_004662 [Streptacidiphilus sp. MAP12-33]|uniref:hypothetical protein n=1 Tax=Streptacidiphilus sp. MAP12-33 TaxID=3156266 RepID=UPI00351460CC